MIRKASDKNEDVLMLQKLAKRLSMTLLPMKTAKKT